MDTIRYNCALFNTLAHAMFIHIEWMKINNIKMLQHKAMCARLCAIHYIKIGLQCKT